MRSVARGIAILMGLLYLVLGLWSFAAPASFAEAVAPFPPYNEHYLHDIGAFQVGLGVALLAAVRWSDGLVVVLAGVAAGSVLHAVAHALDRDLGGRPVDPYTVGLLAVVVLVGLVAATGRRASAG